MIISILFDSIELASLASFTTMTSGQAFGAWVWVAIFWMKPVIVGTMIAYDLLEKGDLRPGSRESMAARGRDPYASLDEEVAA